jgi:hypothetical protein
LKFPNKCCIHFHFHVTIGIENPIGYELVLNRREFLWMFGLFYIPSVVINKGKVSRLKFCEQRMSLTNIMDIILNLESCKHLEIILNEITKHSGKNG